MEVLGGDLAVLVDIVEAHELEDAMGAVQVDQVLVLIVGHEITIDSQETHLISVLLIQSTEKLFYL